MALLLLSATSSIRRRRRLLLRRGSLFVVTSMVLKLMMGLILATRSLSNFRRTRGRRKTLAQSSGGQSSLLLVRRKVVVCSMGSPNASVQIKVVLLIKNCRQKSSVLDGVNGRIRSVNDSFVRTVRYRTGKRIAVLCIMRTGFVSCEPTLLHAYRCA